MFDRFDGGLTIGGVLTELGEDGDMARVQGAAEEAVLDLLEDEGSDALEKVA